MTTPTGGSVLPGKGPAPVVRVANEPAEVAKQYTLADVDPIGRFEGLFYGGPGSGKTVAAATLPPPFRWLDLDGGLKSIRWAFKAGKTSLTKLEDLVAYRPVEAMDGQYPNQPRAFDMASDMMSYWFSPADVDKWNTLVIDSATEWNVLATYKGLHLNGMYPDKKRPLSQSDNINEQAKAMLITGMQDYKSAMGLFQGTLTDLRVECAKHNKNLVIICHEWTEEEEDAEGRTRVVRRLPLLIGQLRTQIPKDFDDVWHFEVYNGTEYKAFKYGEPRAIAKTRWGQIVGPDGKNQIDGETDYRKVIEKVRAFHGVKA